jgi:hypothetical protein
MRNFRREHPRVFFERRHSRSTRTERFFPSGESAVFPAWGILRFHYSARRCPRSGPARIRNDRRFEFRPYGVFAAEAGYRPGARRSRMDTDFREFARYRPVFRFGISDRRPSSIPVRPNEIPENTASGEKESSPANERHLRKHLSHYADFFAVDGEKPSSVHLTVSGKSANTAVIRFISSRVADRSKIDVHPGYFFLNEPDFPLEVPSSGAIDSQALFFSIDAGYAGMGGKNRYFSEVSEKIDSIIARAGKNPETPYFVCVDATSDLSGISDRLAGLIARRASLPNLTVFISSSLTKYNRSERNYHFGIIAKYGSSNESSDPVSPYAFDLEKAVSTSYGDLSPRGILHFPRLRFSAVERQRENGEANRKAFMDGFFAAYENFSGTRVPLRTLSGILVPHFGFARRRPEFDRFRFSRNRRSERTPGQFVLP